ncbi:dermonecrotic toxin domain-containing protein [Pseudomonas sp. ES1]|uniref:dermonecrotic toxin domain-containing protein n=1 Tax=Pseudomonas sp. ES1 TaxID=3424775 RepID=UPI003D34B10D
MTHPPLSPHLSFIHTRMPSWFAQASTADRHLLQRRVRQSHAAMRRLSEALAPVQSIETFCRPLLEQALQHWFPGQPLPKVDQAWVRSNGIGHSWLEAALQNFDAGANVALYDSARSTEKRPGEQATIFVSGVRNLDLGQRYRYHLGDHIDTDSFRELVRRHARATFAAELTQAALQGHLDAKGTLMGEIVFTGLADSAREQLQCGFLSLFDIPLHGPMLVRLDPHKDVERCLLYLPGHPRQALRQYPSAQAASTALTQMLWHQDEREFFNRYVSLDAQPGFAARLRQTLYPRYPYAELYPSPPVLEKGERFSWLKRAFPAPTDLWQETLDKNARLAITFTPWRADAFVEHARIEVERRLQDAATLAVPVDQRDANAQLARIQSWLGVGLTVLNLAGLFVPGLGEVMLVIGGAQLVDEFLDGVHAANEGDADAAISHLFDVLASLTQFAALGAAGRFIEPQGILHSWHPSGADGAQRLWPGELTPFARPRPWPTGQGPNARGLHLWEGKAWLERHEQALPLEHVADGYARLSSAQGMRHQPVLLGNGRGTWLFEHDPPLSWQANTLLEHLGPVVEGLDAQSLGKALQCSGYDAPALRRVLLDHRPIPALLLDSLEAFGARPNTLWVGEQPLTAILARDFPSLSPASRAEILAQASAPDIAQLQQSQRLPLRLAETARLYLRESRISKALARMHQSSGATTDRDALALATLQRLPGWRGKLRLELRDSRLNGRLLASAGKQGLPTKTLVRNVNGYTPYDEFGNELAGRSDVNRAILQALPDSERDALGLLIHEQEKLRDQLFELAASDRRQAALDLGMTPVRPMYRLPTRLPGERRIGYRLSGRGRASWTEDELFDQVFPATPEGDREMLRQRLRHQAGPHAGAFGRLLSRLLVDYRRLDSALQRWVHAPEGLAPVALEQHRGLRETFAQRIRSAWRRESAEGPHDNIDDINLVLEGHGLTSVPALPIRLPHVRLLNLNGLNTADMPGLNAFLEAFPGLRLLDLAQNSLDSLPQALAEMRELQSLDLSENNIALDQEENLALLERMPHLQRLNLTDGIQTLSVATLERLSALPSLAWFQADLNDLIMTAEHFQALQRWPALIGLSLGQNAIVLDEAARTALAGLNRLEMLTLYENPLALAPDLSGWTRLQQLDLELTNISQWPEGLEALMNQEPLVLRQVDLSANELTVAPDLSQTAFARAVRDNLEGFAYSFNGNPFDEAALANLQQAGFIVPPALAQPHPWFADWPEPLRLHIAETADDPQWQPLYSLLERLPDTQDFLNAPDLMRQRMEHVVETLAREEQGEAGANWGRTQVWQQINDLLDDAAQECVDQAIVLFQQVETEVTVWQTVAHAGVAEADERVAVQSARALLRQRLLDERVGALYQARLARRTALRADDHHPTDNPAPALHPDDGINDQELVSDHPDELEMALHARIQLRQRLNLPPQPQAMRFPQLAHLDGPTLQRLGDAVIEGTGANTLEHWAVDQPFWQAWLRRMRPEAFDRLAERWAGASEYFDTLTGASAEGGAYTGPAVPASYIDALEREVGHVDGLAWRVDGVLQRVNLASGRYPNESTLYQQAANLLLRCRTEDEAELMRELTETMVQVHRE